MKTILIIIAGMGDLPDPITLKDTPLTVADIPSLDTLARRGEITSLYTIDESAPISHKNALLSILGYDLERGEPSMVHLMEYGLDNTSDMNEFPSLRPFILPGFSGHGVCVTTSGWVRGVAKTAMIKPLDIYSPGSSDVEILETVADLTIQSITTQEFVLVYVDSPLKASLWGNYDSKVKSLATIDRHLITPIADFVWKSELFINLAVTTDLVTPWHRKKPTKIRVPVITYFNNFDREGDPELKFTEVESMLNTSRLSEPSSLIRHLMNFHINENNYESSEP